MPKSQNEIDRLKRDWLNDPCFDIEDTEGFEDHREELIAFSVQHRMRWTEKAREIQGKRATELGCTVETLVYIQSLESSVTSLQRQLSALETVLEERYGMDFPRP